jgi:hypothetical protein
MALVACNQCRGAVADTAPFCPHCGAPQERQEPAFLSHLLKQFQNMESTRTNLPFFLGAALGVLVVLAGHLLLSRPGAEIDALALTWQIALGALVGCLLGLLVKKI